MVVSHWNPRLACKGMDLLELSHDVDECMMVVFTNQNSFCQRLIDGAFLALRAHCTCIVRYFQTRFPAKSPQARPFQTPLQLGDPN